MKKPFSVFLRIKTSRNLLKWYFSIEIPQFYLIKEKKPFKTTPHKEECCRRWHKEAEFLQKSHEKSREIEFLQKNDEKTEEITEKLRFYQKSNEELSRLLREKEVFY